MDQSHANNPLTGWHSTALVRPRHRAQAPTLPVQVDGLPSGTTTPADSPHRSQHAGHLARFRLKGWHYL